MNPWAVALFGPTGIGKTAVSLQLASHFNGEIISADSMQIYKGLDIGTAKITAHEMTGIPHHVLSFLPPDQQFSAGDFQRKASQHIEEITTRQRIPFIVGGTGFYFNALIDGLSQIPASNLEIRTRIEKIRKRRGNTHLHAILQKIDPKSAYKINPNDTQRLIRAVEVWAHTGNNLSSYHTNVQPPTTTRFLKIGLTMEREKLYERINDRVEKMLQDGLVDEVKSLVSLGYENAPALKGIGYKEVLLYLQNSIDYETMKEYIKRNSRHYAKRQMTWFNGMKDINWFSPHEIDAIITKIKDFQKEISCTA